MPVFFEPHQAGEVCVGIPKHRVQEARVFEASPPRRSVQQREVRVSSQRHETRVSKTERGTHKVHISQVSLDKHDILQRKVCIF